MRLFVVFLLLVGQAFTFTLPHKVDEPFGGLLQTLVSFDNLSHPGHGQSMVKVIVNPPLKSGGILQTKSLAIK